MVDFGSSLISWCPFFKILDFYIRVIETRFLKIGQPYHSITWCALQLSEWNQNKKSSLENYNMIFIFENPLFSFGLFFIFYFFSCQYNMIFVLFTTRIFVIIRIWWVLYLDVFLLILPTIAVILFNIPTKAPMLSTYFRPLYSPFQFSV